MVLRAGSAKKSRQENTKVVLFKAITILMYLNIVMCIPITANFAAQWSCRPCALHALNNIPWLRSPIYCRNGKNREPNIAILISFSCFLYFHHSSHTHSSNTKTFDPSHRQDNQSAHGISVLVFLGS